MIAATNPFLGITAPVTPMAYIGEGSRPMVRVETYGGRIVEVPAALPPESLVQICGGTAWLRGQFPNAVTWRSSDAPDGHGQPPFCAMKAARALIDACMHADLRRTQPKRSGGYAW